MPLRKPTLEQKVATLLNVNEAAELLRVHPVTAYRWARSRRIPSIRIGPRVVRFDPRALERFISSQAV